jgi:excisionase family DNA binding protein
MPTGPLVTTDATAKRSPPKKRLQKALKGSVGLCRPDVRIGARWRSSMKSSPEAKSDAPVRVRTQPPAESPATRLLYDRKEAAKQLSICVRSLDYLIAGKRLETRRIGSKVLIPRAALVKFASANHYESVVNNRS